MGLFLLLFDAPILRLFTDDAAVIREGVVVIRTCALIQPVMAASFVFSGGLRGAGDTRTTMLITVGSIWALRLVAAYVLGSLLGLGLLGAWLGVGVDFSFRALLFWLRFRGGKWAALRV
jgi:Na+-driven multidrug efflux pump